MQEVIVYRNPLEAMLWNSVSSAEIVPIASGIFVFFAVFLTLHSIVETVKLFRPYRYNTTVSYANLIVSTLISVTVVWKMWI